MNKMKLFGVLIFASILGMNASIYDFTFPTLEGNSQHLASFAGKKIMIITIPVSRDPTADSLLNSLDALALSDPSGLRIIAVPSREDGFTPERKTELLTWYRTKLGGYIKIADGLFTRSTSGTAQHPLFRWLTHAEENQHFGIDVEGPGTKYFINRTGELVGVLRAETKITSGAVRKVLELQ